MPKIIENLNEEILRTAKETLLTEGFQALTIRKVAQKCHIAVGTVYNYFPSKEMLSGTVMLNDWRLILARSRSEIEQADSCIEALQRIYEGIRDFSLIYKQVWDEYGGTVKISTDYHARMIGQLCELTSLALNRFDVKAEPDPTHFLAEVILSVGSRTDASFDKVAPFLEKVLK